MQLSVVIVNYNVKYFLEQALYAVRKASEGLETEVFVVDNNSVDGSVEMVRKKFPEVLLIENSENKGFSTANNQAIRIAKGEYILLLNPDTVVQEDTFKKVISFMDSNEDAGAVGVKMIDGKGHYLPESKRGLPTPQVAFYKIFGLARLFPKSKTFGKYHLGYLDKDQTHEVDVLSGAFMMLRSSALKKTGYLDETFFMYGEDIDLSYRVKQAGFKNYYFPHTTIIHYKGESTKKSSVNYVFVFYNAMIIFAKKHYSNKNAWFFSFLINFAIYLRAAIAIVSRFIRAVYQPLLDGILIGIGMYVLKTYWEHNIKFIQGGKYPVEFMLYNVSFYVICWLVGVYLSGGYDKNTRIFKILRGIFFGLVTISVCYAFFPEDYRFSRMLILLGSVLAASVVLGSRLVLHFLRMRNLNIRDYQDRNTIIVGNHQESNRVLSLLNRYHAASNVVGFVGIDENEEKDNNYLGNVKQLREIVEVFPTDEIIFCSKDISAQQIIRWMTSIHSPSVQFKIVPEQSLFIIGSNSKDSAGDFYTIDINLSISKPHNVRNKRIFDLASSLFLLILSPIIVFFIKRPAQYIMNLLQVLFGRKTWVGYAQAQDETTLPRIKRGILTPLDDVKAPGVTFNTTRKLNLLYARNYSVEKDLFILIHSFGKLGN